MRLKVPGGAHIYRRTVSVVAHLGLTVVSTYVAFWLRFDGEIPEEYLLALETTLPTVVAVRALTFVPFRLYEGLWRYTSIYDLRNIISGVVLSSVIVFALTDTGLGLIRSPRSVLIIDAILLICMMGGIRLSRRIYREFSRLEHAKAVLVFGAGDAGELVVRDMRNSSDYDREPIGFIDDDEQKVGQRIHGAPVLGTRDELPTIMAQYRPHEILLAVPSVGPGVLREVVRAFEPYKVPITTLPSLRDLVSRSVMLNQVRELALEDLLPRMPVGLDRTPLEALMAGKRVLVTGAGGSIGKELARQICSLAPERIVLLERYESSLHAILTELRDDGHEALLRPVLADVTDERRIRDVLSSERPHIVFHTAAHKHVPMMEWNPCEAVKNNVAGTAILVEAAERTAVERFILISTDKAVNPTSVMGASKRVAELLVRGRVGLSATHFSTVRFGNVLGSSGSVVPRFLEQIRAGGPVTVTDPEVRRYFMLIDEAVRLVLHAATLGGDGVTYVLDMGEQIRVLDVARNLIRLNGLVPDEEIQIELVGLRPGEKAFEELVGVGEAVERSPVERILRVQPGSQQDLPRLEDRLATLYEHARAGDSATVVRMLVELVPTYTPGRQWESTRDRTESIWHA